MGPLREQCVFIAVESPTLYSEAGSPAKFGNLEEQLASELQGSACVCPLGLGLQVCAAVPVFVT